MEKRKGEKVSNSWRRFFFQAFPPIQHIQRHVGLGEIGFFLAGAQFFFQGANRLCGLKAEPGFKQKHHRVKEATSLPHNPKPTLALLTQLQKHREETITDESFCLTRSRPGNTCRRRRGHSPRARDGRKYKKGRLWRRGGNVNLEKIEQYACCPTLLQSTQSFPSSHPSKKV